MRIWDMRIFPSLKKRMSQGPACNSTILLIVSCVNHLLNMTIIQVYSNIDDIIAYMVAF